jgi:hypothetical protein
MIGQHCNPRDPQSGGDAGIRSEGDPVPGLDPAFSASFA